jgi:hypothetical protein
MTMGRSTAFRYGDTKMTLGDFRQSLTATESPANLTPALAGLWFDAKAPSIESQQSHLRWSREADRF